MRMLDEKESELVEEVDGVLVCCCESLLRPETSGVHLWQEVRRRSVAQPTRRPSSLSLNPIG